MHGIKWMISTVVLAGGAWLLGAGLVTGGENDPIPKDRQEKLLQKYPEADANDDGTLTRQELRQYWQAHRGEGWTGRQGWAGRSRPGRRGHRPGFGGMFGPQGGPPPADSPIVQRLLRRHPELDADGDGTLSPEEWQAAREKLGPPPGRPPMVRHAGMIMALNALLDHFDKADADGNGQLSRKEIAQMKKKLAAEGPAAFGPPRGMMGGRYLLDHFADADTNKDGELSAGEIESFCADRPLSPRRGLTEWFAEADTDGNGNLSKTELEALLKAKPRPRWHGRRGRGTPETRGEDR